MFRKMVPNRLKIVQHHSVEQDKACLNRKLNFFWQPNVSTRCSWIGDEIVIDYSNEFITHEVKKVYVTDNVTGVYNNLDGVNVIIVLLCVDIQ